MAKSSIHSHRSNDDTNANNDARNYRMSYPTVLNKRMEVEKDIVDELLLVCGVIGTTVNEGNAIVPVTDCLSWLQDLQRALRRDDDQFRPISLLISKWKVVEQKLLPLVLNCRHDTPMILTILKILVILTKPISENARRAGLMAVNTKTANPNYAVVQEQIKLRENAMKQSEVLMDYKRVVVASHAKKDPTQKGLLSIFVSLLAEPLSRSGAARTDTDHLTIELVLHLFRNLLSAEPLLNTASETSRKHKHLHQEMINLFEKELVLEILLVLGSELELAENAQYNLLMMELLHHLLKYHDPSVVAQQSVVTPNGNTSTKRSSVLAKKLKVEKEQRRYLATSRHGHFGGTWTTQQQTGKRKYVAAARFQTANQTHMRTQAKRKNRSAEPFVGRTSQWIHSRRIPVEEGPATRRANRNIHRFCNRFLSDCYGPVMKSLKNEFRRDSVRLEENDKVVFFRLVWFFNQWWRLSKSADSKGQLGNLIFTMDLFTFNLMLNATDQFHQRKEYSRMEQCVALYNEMMHLLHDMRNSVDSTEKIMGLGLMDKLFYGNEPLDRVPRLLGYWTAGTNSREYACNLVQLCQVSLKILDKDEILKLKNKTSESGESGGKIDKMLSIAMEFDVDSHFCRRIVSNQLILILTHILNQYKVNSEQINNDVVSLFSRLSQVELSSPRSEEDDTPINPLGPRRVTFEPLVFNIQFLMIAESILNEVTKEKEFDSLVEFCSNSLFRFYEAAQSNPMVYIECLFRHVGPQRYCNHFSHMYVNDELQMLAERELLLKENQFIAADETSNYATDFPYDDDKELEFSEQPLLNNTGHSPSEESGLTVKITDDDCTLLDQESSKKRIRFSAD